MIFSKIVGIGSYLPKRFLTNNDLSMMVNTSDEYEYTVSGSPATPATGTITSTFAPISGDTNSSGDISDTRTYSSDQPITGRIRRATSGTLYMSSPISGTIDSSNGLSITVQLIPDE